MPGIGGLHRVHGKRAHRVDGEKIEGCGISHGP
jgi:hypothetical protein